MTNIFNKIDNENWSKEIKEYQSKRKNLEWGINPKPDIVTTKIIKESETMYDPILQKYRDKNLEEQTKKIEKQTMRNYLAKTKDNQIRIEQTYDLINLHDKLKDFKDQPNYPRMKSQRIRKNVEGTNVKYNIISNEGFDNHHFDKPEKRPNIEKEATEKHKFNNMPINSYRDYDLVSGKYKEYHEEKTNVDNEIQKLNAAEKYWKRNKYNPILVKYNDDDRESEFQRKKEEENKIIASKSRKIINRNARGFRDVSLYNPINMAVLEKEGCSLMDMKANNKVKRYELRDKLEKHYFYSDIEQEKKNKELLDNKYSYRRYNVIENRGFDIITMDQNEKIQNENKRLKHNKTEWDKICENSKGNLRNNLTSNTDNSINKIQKTLSRKTSKDFYTTSFKDSYKEYDLKSVKNNFINDNNGLLTTYKEDLNQTKIEKNKWFNSNVKKDYVFNEGPYQIINEFNNRKISTTNPMKTRPNIFGDAA